MAIYVDALMDYFVTHKWRHGMACHMIADSVAELKAFAVKIGMRVEWFQNGSTPHFDLTESLREIAVANGAIEVNRRELVAKIKELRAKREDMLGF